MNKERYKTEKHLAKFYLKNLTLALLRFYPENFNYNDIEKILTKASGISPNLSLKYSKKTYEQKK